MGGRRSEGCIAESRTTRMEETSWELRTMGAPFEGGQGPEGAVAPYMDGNLT